MRIPVPTALCLLLLGFGLLSGASGRSTIPDMSVAVDGVYDIKSGGIEPPRIRKKREPEYSPEGRFAQMQGKCLLELVVDRQGLPRNITLVSPLGFGLDEKAIQAVSEWRFHPAKKDGIPVTARTTAEVSFRLPHAYFDNKMEDQRTKYNVMLREIRNQGSTLTAVQEVAMRGFAKLGFTAATAVIGFWNLSALNAHRDVTVGVRMIQEAAIKHQPAALFVQGQLLIMGRLVPQNLPEGLQDLQEAAILGSTPAQRELGVRYEAGVDIPKDAERARRYYRQCARAGDADCQYAMSRNLQAQSSGSDELYLQALAWLHLAAEKDHPEAKKQLAEHSVTLTAQQNKQVEALISYLERPGAR